MQDWLCTLQIIKVYKKKNTQDKANILDYLSAMAVSGPVDDVDGYAHEWTMSVNRGGLLKVSYKFHLFKQLEIPIKGMQLKKAIEAETFCY